MPSLHISIAIILIALIRLVCLGATVYLFVLLVRCLRRYLKTADVRQEASEVKKTLGETIKAQRTRCGMTQEFVAESLGVSRQAVSKWESGKTDPSTSNLLALAKLFGIPAEELLKGTAGGDGPEE